MSETGAKFNIVIAVGHCLGDRQTGEGLKQAGHRPLIFAAAG